MSEAGWAVFSAVGVVALVAALALLVRSRRPRGAASADPPSDGRHPGSADRWAGTFALVLGIFAVTSLLRNLGDVDWHALAPIVVAAVVAMTVEALGGGRTGRFVWVYAVLAGVAAGLFLSS